MGYFVNKPYMQPETNHCVPYPKEIITPDNYEIFKTIHFVRTRSFWGWEQEEHPFFSTYFPPSLPSSFLIIKEANTLQPCDA